MQDHIDEKFEEREDERAILEIELLTDYLDKFSLVNSREELVDLSREIFEKKLPSQYTGLYLWNEEEQRLEMLVASGFSLEERIEAERTAMDRHVGQVYRSGEPILIDDTFDPNADWSQDSKRNFKVRTRLVMPVKSFDRTVGVFIIASDKPNRFTTLEKSFFNVICKIAGYIYYRLDQLEKSEAQNRKLADLALIATKTSNNVIITDRQGRIEWVNDAFINQTGFSLEESLGQSPGKLLNNSLSSYETRIALREAISEGKHIKTEVTNQTKSGKTYTNEIDITPVIDDHGQVLKYISVQKDVTERNRFLEELRATSLKLKEINNRFETIAKFSRIGIWEWDVIENKTFWSDIAFQVFGVKNQVHDDMFAYWQSLIHPDDFEKTLHSTYSLVEGKVNMIETQYRSIDEAGQIRHLRGLTYMERDDKGQNLKMIGSVVDVSNEINAANTLSTSEAKYRDIFNNNVAGVFRTTTSGQILDVNSAFLKIFGYTKEELLSTGLSQLYFSEQDRELYINDLTEKGRLENYFLRTRHKSGSPMDLLINVQLVHSDVESFVEGTLMDISEIRRAERKVQSSEMLFRGIFDNNLAGVFLVNSEGKIVDGNNSAAQILGVDGAFIEHDYHFSDFILSREKWDKIQNLIAENKVPASFRLQIMPMQGLKGLDVLLTCNQVELEGLGNCQLFTAIDTSEADLLNQKLIESEKRYRDLFENSLEIIQSFGPEGNLIFCNQKWFNTLGYTEEEFTKMNLFDIIVPEEHEHCRHLFERVLNGESVQNIDVTFIGKTGNRVELNGNVVPMLKNGKMESTHSFFRDVSIEKKQKQAIEDQRKFYEKVLENVPAEISILDKDQTFLYLNPVSIASVSPRSNSVGKRLYDRLIEIGRIKEEVEYRIGKFKDAERLGTVVSFEETLQPVQGSKKTILRQFFPLFDDQGKLDLMISVGTDVTELEDNRRRLLDNNEELRKVNHELDRFVYSVSHDLRAPIASVKGLLTLMRENEASDEVKKTYVDMMNTVMDRMDHVIFEILDYSRNSRLEVVAEKMDIVNLVNGAVNTYRHFSPKPVLLEIEENIQSEFYADSRRIQSVLNNLISNAIKYSLKGPQDIQLKVSVHVNSESLKLIISDNGEGIRESYIEKIFDMFYRASNTSSGSGLGLYICREVLKKLEGTISVKSEEGKGTSFSIMVPNRISAK